MFIWSWLDEGYLGVSILGTRCVIPRIGSIQNDCRPEYKSTDSEAVVVDVVTDDDDFRCVWDCTYLSLQMVMASVAVPLSSSV